MTGGTLDNHRIVVKLGTSTLTGGTAYLSPPRMVDLVRQMADLRAAGAEVVLVSSGAMAAGSELLGFPQLPKAIPAKQMLSAIGQPRLMARWAQLFELYGYSVAQVLLTREDLRNRHRYLNARNTLLALLDQGVVPIVNENDTVATGEIRVGDNDNLSARVANVVDADLLVLLTDQPGLYTADPRANPDARLVPLVDTPDIDPALWQAASGRSGRLGVGGMVTKLEAADLARRSGTAVIIANGSTPDVLPRIARGEAIGTRFTPTVTAVESRKRYILSGGEDGRLTVDAGAARALHKGRSLLPVGLLAVSGSFGRGATVRVYDPDTRETARGIVSYNANDCRQLCGRQSKDIETVLGYFYGEEIIHRNNLVLM